LIRDCAARRPMPSDEPVMNIRAILVGCCF
jgi:hypothetical protein